MLIFANVAVQAILTFAVVLIYVFIFIFANKWITKRQDSGKSGIIGLYLLLFLLFLISIGIILLIFGLDYRVVINNIWTSVSNGITEYIGAILGTVITVFMTILILKVVKFLVKKATLKEGPMKKRMATILKVVRSIISYVVEIIAILVILSLWGVDVLPALAGLGILGLVIGMGAQSLIKDIIAGFFIVFEHHFDVGDIVEINGFKGEVVDIGLKSSKIKNWKGDIKIYANGSISDLINYSLTPSMAIIEFGISYKEDIKKTIEILENELKVYKDNFPEIIEDPKVLGVTSLQDSSVNLTVIVKTATEKHYAIERAIRQQIKQILDQNGIEIPFPQMVVHKPE
jgi:small conductance mechanosensitive channel